MVDGLPDELLLLLSLPFGPQATSKNAEIASIKNVFINFSMACVTPYLPSTQEALPKYIKLAVIWTVTRKSLYFNTNITSTLTT